MSCRSILDRWVCIGLLFLACSAADDPAPAPAQPPAPAATAAPEAPRLVLLYVPCTVNKSLLAPYDPDVPFTPNLAAFAREAVVFERHQSEAGLSGIAYASIFSGTGAVNHGVYTHPRRLTDAVYHVAEAFADAGYHTVFYDGHGMASARLNYGQGVAPLDVHKRLLTGDDRYFRRVVAELQNDPQARVFVMAAFMVSHAPYATDELQSFCESWPDRCPDGLEGAALQRYLDFYAEHNLDLSFDYPRTLERLRQAGLSRETLTSLIDALYASRIHHLDTLFGGVIDALRDANLLDESLIAFTADHGEVLSRDNALFRWNHGFALAPEALGVPWLLHAPGLAPGRHAPVTRSIDVYPTLAGLAGLDLAAHTEVTGVDLAPVLRGERVAQDLPAFSQTSFIPRFNFPRTASWQVYRNFYPRSEMDLVWVGLRRGDQVFRWRNLGDERFGALAYDLAKDPGETHDLFDPGNPVHVAAREELIEYKRLLELGYAEDVESGDTLVNPADETQLLRSLGYVP